MVNLYREKKPKIEEIIKQANKDQKEWESVIEIFNQRFLVPFKVELQNQKDILLNKDTAQFRFIFSDDNQDMKRRFAKTFKRRRKESVIYLTNLV